MKWLVVRSWVVEAETASEAAERAKPGEHKDERALMRVPGTAAIRLTFANPSESRGD